MKTIYVSDVSLLGKLKKYDSKSPQHNKVYRIGLNDHSWFDLYKQIN